MKKSECAVCNQVKHTSGFVPGVKAWNRNVKLKPNRVANMLMIQSMSERRRSVKNLPFLLILRASPTRPGPPGGGYSSRKRCKEKVRNPISLN